MKLLPALSSILLLLGSAAGSKDDVAHHLLRRHDDATARESLPEDDSRHLGGNKVEICHFPEDEPYNFHTISVNENSVQKHIDNHGDLIGTCNEHCDTACDDGDPCTIDHDGSQNCEVVGCYQSPRPLVDCDDGDLCTVNFCNSATGGCGWTPAIGCEAGYACDDSTGSPMCVDIDECLDNPCTDPTPVCTNTPGGYTCESAVQQCYTGTANEIITWCNTLPEEDKCCQHSSGGIACTVSGGGTATICRNSCNGENACNELGNGISIGQDSCLGRYACWGVGKFSAPGSSLIIGSNSCNGVYAACYVVGYLDSSVRDVAISDNACLGERSCDGLGRYDTNSVSIGESACDGFGACEQVGEVRTASITIGARSCVGSWACRRAGCEHAACGGAGASQSTIGIGTDSCVGAESCWQAGGHGHLSIDSDMCHADCSIHPDLNCPDSVCNGCGHGVAGDVTVSGSPEVCSY